MQKANQESKDFSRRKFLKGGVALGAAAGLSAVTGGKTTEDVVQAFGKKELDSFPHEISQDFEKFDGTKNMGGRFISGDPEIMKRIEGLPGYFGVHFDNSKPGATGLDFALSQGANSVNFDFAEGINSPLYTWDKKPFIDKYKFASKEDATKAIKRAAKFYGADLVGITAFDERWLYSTQFSLADRKAMPAAEFPVNPKSVIVIAVEMDYEALSSAPTTLAQAATFLGYSNMAETNYKLSTFIRALGYNAFGAGNETSLNVPLAIAAGLGEQGRQGLLITYEYGPRVRLCKIYTDMDLNYDKPIKFGASDFCKVCKKCAYSCPSQSISYNDEMTWEPEIPSISNQKGVKKYYVNVESCFVYWNTVQNCCNVCITSCPFNKPDFWHHRITTALTATPLKPFLNEMDDLFGYGDVFDEKAVTNFWGLDSYIK